MPRTTPHLNTNSLWAEVGVQTLANLGLKHVVISPGSRSTALAHAFAASSGLELKVALDERSAGFIALGIAKATRLPAALLCTSGTAAANYLPAVIEARLSSTPLLILTADRPPELRECHSGQTIRQNGLFGTYPVWSAEATVPSTHLHLLRHWRQLLVDAWHRSLMPLTGPIHLNLPFGDPLAPNDAEESFRLPKGFSLKAFTSMATHKNAQFVITPRTLTELLPKTDCGVIVVGPHAFADRAASVSALTELSCQTGWPILADGAGTLRGDLAGNSALISGYDLILRNPAAARRLSPKAAIFIGTLPTSKVLRAWLKEGDITAIQVGRSGENTDPTHSRWRRCEGQLLPTYETILPHKTEYAKTWHKLQKSALKKLTRIVQVDWAFEGRVISILNEVLGQTDRLFIGNSMPIRDLEWFYHPSNPGPEILSNRGANGIDGTVSTALGASLDRKPTVLLCGDLAFLHDSNALLSANEHQGDFTVIVIQNQGGGIFNHLSVSQSPYFQLLWGTPQVADIGKLCTAHKVHHNLAVDWNALRKLLKLRGKGVRVIEFRTDREASAAWRRRSFH